MIRLGHGSGQGLAGSAHGVDWGGPQHPTRGAAPMKITAVHVDTLELTMEEPFVIASSAMAFGPCDLVRVETDEGITGIGEACAVRRW